METAVVPYSHPVADIEGPGQSFDARRREVYLRERVAGVPHATAVRRAGVSPSTYARYSAAVGQVWHDTVRWAVEESLDPIRAVRRTAALNSEPWAVRAEIGDGRAATPAGRESSPGSVTLVVVGGADGINDNLLGLLDRLRQRQEALSEAGEPAVPATLEP